MEYFQRRYHLLWGTLLLVATVMILPLAPQPAHAVQTSRPTRYTITDLGTLGGSFSRANAINNLGQIVGGSLNTTPDPITPGTNEARALLWDRGKMTDLGTFGGADSDQFGGNVTGATGINDRGQIVGGATYNAVADPACGDDNPPITCNHAFLWANGKMTFLGTLKGVSSLGNTASHADAINARGQVVGDSMVPIPDPNNSSAPGAPQIHAFLWERGKMIDIGTLPSPLNTYSQAFGINDRGQIVGESGYHDGGGHPFIWSKGVMTDIGTLGGPHGFAVAINNAGQVVGGADTNVSDPSNPGGVLAQAFLWTGGKAHNLGTIPGETSGEAHGINNRGQIVGLAGGNADGKLRAVLWQNGRAYDLTKLLPAHSGWSLNEADAINDRGQIVGYGVDPHGQTHAYVLTPVHG